MTITNVDIIPVVSAVHPNPIYCLSATENQKWIVTGSEDGFIRKYDFYSSLNGSTLLTGAQKHGLVDSIQKAGVILSAWENEDAPLKSIVAADMDPLLQPQPRISPVYSIDIHSKGVWLVTGCESGSINLWSVRHEEGKLQHVLRGHKAPVSALKISPSEHSLLSGSWDKSIKLWDLDQGNILKDYTNHASQITSLEYHSPTSNSQLFLASTYDGCTFVYDTRKPGGTIWKGDPDPSTPPWAVSSCWSSDGQYIYVGRRNGSVDEYDFKNRSVVRNLKMPIGSGSVTAVAALKDSRQLLIASYDNIRLWDLDHKTSEPSPTLPRAVRPESVDGEGSMYQDDIFPSIQNDTFDVDFFMKQQSPGKSVLERKAAEDALLEQDLLAPSMPFTIIPGHHGGFISSLMICGDYLVSASGNRGYEGTSTNNCLIYTITKKEQ